MDGNEGGKLMFVVEKLRFLKFEASLTHQATLHPTSSLSNVISAVSIKMSQKLKATSRP